MELRQYQVVVVNLDPTIGHEISKMRPCVIISPYELNMTIGTVTVAPITSTKKNYPTRAPIKLDQKVGYVAIDQIRTIDKKRIVKVLAEVSVKERLLIKSIIKETFVD